jgi:TPR repeat protein
MLKTTLSKRFAGSFILAVCLLQTASYAYAEQDLTEIRKMAENGDAKAQLSLAAKYEKGEGVAQNYKQAVAWSRKAAEQGDARGQLNLGTSYLEGQGVAQDDNQAVSWFRKAAEQGLGSAQAYLGLMYEGGTGVKQDNSQAYVWYSVAVANGFSRATDGRDEAAEKLSQAQLDAAQELAGVYLERYPKRK